MQMCAKCTPLTRGTRTCNNNMKRLEEDELTVVFAHSVIVGLLYISLYFVACGSFTELKIQEFEIWVLELNRRSILRSTPFTEYSCDSFDLRMERRLNTDTRLHNIDQYLKEFPNPSQAVHFKSPLSGHLITKIHGLLHVNFHPPCPLRGRARDSGHDPGAGRLRKGAQHCGGD